MAMPRTGKPLAAAVLLLCLVLSSLPVQALVSSPLSTGGARDGMIKVRLDSLGQFTSLQVTTQGSYSLLGETELSINSGSRLQFAFNTGDGLISLTYSGHTYPLGGAFQLRRHQSDQTAGFTLDKGRAPGNLYPADLYVFGVTTEAGTRFTAVANVFLEDYLYGVLPYEMGEGAHPEALKAQAVAARTYAMARMGRGVMDVVDTTQDQVYAGTPTGYPNARKAVDQTRGIVIKNGGELTATYYTASNGGQTESIYNVWRSSGHPYLDVRDDPYDLNNPASRVKAAVFPFHPGEMDQALLSLITNKARAVTGDNNARVERILHLVPHTPMYKSPSRLYTKLDVDINLETRGSIIKQKLTFDLFDELEGPLGLSINAQKNELFDVTRTETSFVLSARRYGHGLGMSQRGAMHMGSMGYTYDQILAFYYPGCVRVGYTLGKSILSALVPGQASSPQPSQQTPAPISETDPALGQTNQAATLYAGASLTSPILLHLPANTRVQVLAQDGQFYGVRYGQLNGFITKASLQFGGALPGEQVAATKLLGYGTIIGADAVNLRAGASLSHPVVMTLARGTLLPLLSQQGNFYQVQYGTQLGYVSRDYIDRMDSHPYQALAQGPEEALVNSTDATLLSQASANAARLAALQQGEKLLLLRLEGAWAYVQYGERFGYVLSRHLQLTGSRLTAIGSTPSPTDHPAASTTPTETPQPLIAWVQTPSGSLNLRQEPNSKARILATIKPGTQVTVVLSGGEWSKIAHGTQEGYVMSRFLRFATTQTPAASPTPHPSQTPGEMIAPGVAWVNTPGGSLNLRAQARANGDIIARIPRGDRVAVLAQLPGWAQVAHDGKTGYVVIDYLRFEAGTSAVPTPAPGASGTPAVNTTTPGASGSPAPKPVSTPQPNLARDPTLVKLAEPRDAQAKPGAIALPLLAGCDEAASLLATIRPGDSLLVLEEGATWCKVAYDGQEGYVKKSGLSMMEPQS